MIPYIHILFFFYQNAAIYTHFVFFVKMLQHIHICVGFWDQNATIYTHFGGFLGSKCCHIYTFLESNFFRKNEKKKNNRIKIYAKHRIFRTFPDSLDKKELKDFYKLLLNFDEKCREHTLNQKHMGKNKPEITFDLYQKTEL